MFVSLGTTRLIEGKKTVIHEVDIHYINTMTCLKLSLNCKRKSMNFVLGGLILSHGILYIQIYVTVSNTISC